MAIDVRITQKVVESFNSEPNPEVRETQKVVEAFRSNSPTVLITQKVLEPWISGSPSVALSQKVVEVWYTFSVIIPPPDITGSKWALDRFDFKLRSEETS